MTVSIATPAKHGAQSGLDLQLLIELSARGLPAMFDPQSGLFCNTTKQSAAGLHPYGVSHRYSVMSLLGLHRLKEHCGVSTPVPVRDVARRLIQERDWVNNIGDLGLLLWLCAVVIPDEVESLLSEAQVPSAVRQLPTSHTMELAWLLTGIAYVCALGSDTMMSGLAELGRWTVDRLLANQGPHGFFGHLSVTDGPSGRLRGHVGSFADQAYPIYALSRFAQVQSDRAALHAARRCADATCATQGPLGQWWWHYDALRGRVAQTYPVYSVHQEGMAPMALFAAQDAIGVSYEDAAYKGLAWLLRNELGRDLREPALGVVWRDVEVAPRWLSRVVAAGEYAGLGFRSSSARLRVNRECRPYELGWLLYALAATAGRTH